MTTLEEPMTTSCATTDSSQPGSGGGICAGGFLEAHLSSFTSALSAMDDALLAVRTVDRKTDELTRFALSIKARSEPCVKKHFQGSLDAGATEREIAYVFALTMREAAGADDCWTHAIISSMTSNDPASVLDDEQGSCCG